MTTFRVVIIPEQAANDYDVIKFNPDLDIGDG